jgi:Family of unknown function (DUF6262)
MTAAHLRDGRRADAERRHRKVVASIAALAKDGADLTVSAVARHAGVSRSYLYRHPDLLDHLHLAQAGPPTGGGPSVSRESLRADLAGAQARANRLQARVYQLESRLSESLGERVWQESGLGAIADIDALQRQVASLEQQIVELNRTLDERTQELAAARAANRELMIDLNIRRQA